MEQLEGVGNFRGVPRYQGAVVDAIGEYSKVLGDVLVSRCVEVKI